MDCCSTFDSVFDDKIAKKDYKNYRKKGLNKQASLVVDFLKNKIDEKEVLDIGCGIGFFGMELIKSGASNSLGIEISRNYLSYAEKLRNELKLDEKAQFQIVDFIEKGEEFKNFDVTVSDKVICCYPHLDKFIDSTTKRTKKYYGIIYPRYNFLIKFITIVLNTVIKIPKKFKGFKFYIRTYEEISDQIKKNNFKQIFDQKKGIWRVTIFERY